MKSILYTAALFFSAMPAWSQPSSSMFQSERITEPMSPRNIQILLEKDASEVLLEVKGPYTLFNPHDGSQIGSGLLGKRFLIHELETGLKWGEEFAGIHQIYIQPRSPSTSIFINGIQYDGSVAVYGVSGTVNVVNDIDIESYVKSILTTQFISPLEPEVMSSLAILARTNAYYHATKNPDSFWHVSASETSYTGNGLVVQNSLVAQAVEKTRHLILVYMDGQQSQFFPTAWTENSAGKTASYESMFRKEAPSPEKGVAAPHAALTKQDSKWSYQISKKALAQYLGIPQIKSIETFVDPDSQKVYAVRVQDQSETHNIDFFTLQNQIGKNHLLSSDFTVSLKDDSVLFQGYGRGHGVGLCLYSASALAQNGENAVKILSKFFPETCLYNIHAIPSNMQQD